jgi:hypothetical protein
MRQVLEVFQFSVIRAVAAPAALYTVDVTHAAATLEEWEWRALDGDNFLVSNMPA